MSACVGSSSAEVSSHGSASTESVLTESASTTSSSVEFQYRYDASMAQTIEAKWQEYWSSHGTFWAANVEGNLTDGKGQHAQDRPSYFALDMFPYPSGKGLHVGHPMGYLATDVICRYHRMKGENVLHAMGYDAFGLPAEQYAVQTGQHPRITTQANIANMRRQLLRMGLSLDERRSFATIDREYVRWTQWIFARLFEAWYDEDAQTDDGHLGAARPISTLVEQFASGQRQIPGHEGKSWEDLSAKEQADVLNEYRLAYIAHSPVNWCPGLGTVLANEEVTADGRSERGNYPVFKRQLRQWSMRITAYAERLLNDLDEIDWPEKVKLMQRNWIGKSRGAHIQFAVTSQANVSGSETSSSQISEVIEPLEVYTTRPDTIFGAVCAVVNVHHPLLTKLPDTWDSSTPEEWQSGYDSPREALQAYRCTVDDQATSTRERNTLEKTKTGQFTGLYAVNPVTGKLLPIFAADYVLADYGTGAIMAVPGGDQRDFDFAQHMHLPIIYTMQPCEDSGETLEDYVNQRAYESHEGRLINSSIEATHLGGESLDLNGLSIEEASEKIVAWLERYGVGSGSVRYKLRDWLFSRQRYWGEPFPVVYDDEGVAHIIPDNLLPVDLPEVPDYQPRTFDPDDAQSNPEAPLGRNQDWVDVELDLGDGLKRYHRETNTMPNWAGSCWYYMRYADPTNEQAFINPVEYDYWMGKDRKSTGKTGGVDLYIGGVEHAVLHLLYARFWHKVLYDLGFVGSAEPFHRLFNQGMMQAYAYTDERGQYVPAMEVTAVTEQGEEHYEWQGQRVDRVFGKMGKSLKNVITPDDMYEQYGADAFRLSEMGMGPLEESRPWNGEIMTGSMRMLQRLWRNVVDEASGKLIVSDEELTEDLLKIVHRTIAEVTDHMENMRLNTAIARLIVLNNALTGLRPVPRAAVEPLILMLAPLAPHICEELWSLLGHEESLSAVAWPVADERYLGQDTVTAVVQIAGKVRGRLEVSPDISEQDLQEKALHAVADRIEGHRIRKVIVRAPKIVSIVLD